MYDRIKPWVYSDFEIACSDPDDSQYFQFVLFYSFVAKEPISAEYATVNDDLMLVLTQSWDLRHIWDL